MRGRGWKNQTLERERCPRRTRSLWTVLACCALALTPWGVWLAQHNDCLELSYAVAGLRTEGERLEERERRLRMELGALETLARIESWAESRGDLTHPEPERVVILPTGRKAEDHLVARTTVASDSTKNMR